jgi:hypothetical protein
MTTNQDLMQRLAVSKKIMEKTESLQRNNSDRRMNPIVEDFQPVEAKYNLPSEFLPQQEYKTTSYDPTIPLDENRILNSKLPDEIKRLMIEQPIVQPSSMGGGTVLSDEIIEGASRLMKKEKLSETPQTQTPKQKITETHSSSNINMGEIKNIIRDVVRDTVRDVVREELKDAGMLVESTENSNEVIQFKVGQHLFVGRVTKIKKLQK